MRHTNPAPKTLTGQEQLRLLRETVRRPEDLRDHILFAMALGTGLRVSELVALNVGDVRNGKGAKGLVTLRPETTKGNKGGEIALPERLRRKVSRFLKWKQDRREGEVSGQVRLPAIKGGGAGCLPSVATATWLRPAMHFPSATPHLLLQPLEEDRRHPACPASSTTLDSDRDRHLCRAHH
jgi:integrase